MRVLVLNSYDFPANILADSSYTLTRRILENLPESYYSIWPMPTLEVSGVKRYGAKGDVIVPPRCDMLHVPMYAGRAASEQMVSGELFDLFNPINGQRVDYDVILTNNQAAAARIVDWTIPTKGQPSRPPVIILDYNTPFVGSDCDLAYLKTSPEKVLMHYTGIANAAATVVFTDFMRQKTLSQSRDFFSSFMVRQIERKIHYIPMIFSHEAIKNALSVKRMRKRNRVTVYWGGRLTATKRVQLALEVADYLFSFGENIDMVVTVPGDNIDVNKMLVGAIKRYPAQIELFKSLSQEDAWRQMSTCHVSIFPQSLRYGPASPLEQLAAGLIVLINRKDSAGVLPPEYPWFFSSMSELQVLVRRVIRNFKEEKKKQKEWQTFVIENRSVEANISKFTSLIETSYAPVSTLFKNMTSALFLGRIKEPAPKEIWSHFFQRLVKEHHLFGQLKNSIIPNRLNPSYWGVYQTLRNHLNIVDTVKDPVLRRK